jgi:N-acetylmuramoyl-L-alanine amidase
MLLVLAAAFAGAAPARALTVTGARFGVHPDKTRLVFELSQATEFRAFVLADPYRLIVDMPRLDWRPGAIPVPAGGDVLGVREGDLAPGPGGSALSRIVIDMRRPVAVKAAFLIGPANGKPERLVVDFAAVGDAAFAAARNEVHGTLGAGPAADMQASIAPPPSAPHSTTMPPVSPSSMEPSYAPALSAPPPGLPGHKPERAAGLAASPYADMAPPPLAPGEKPLIIIDAGHGGVDPGAIGAGGVFEKNVTLAMARELKRQLEETRAYRVHLTRDSDIYLKLHERVDIARARKADLFISLHADSVNRANIRGASVYTLSEKASDQQTALLADRENRADLIAGVDLSGEDKQVAGILVDLAMRDTMNQSSFFANTLVSDLRRSGVSILEKPHRHAGFAVLKAPDIPSVLIEMGFLSNRSEAGKLSDAAYRSRFAHALVGGIGAYFDQVRRNQRL